MGKEEFKKIFNDYIDSVDKIQEFTISNEIEELDMSTLDGEWIERRSTGITNIYITTYREPK